MPGPYCVAGQPLSWNSVMAYKVPGTMNGTNYFDLVNGWNYLPNPQVSGGSWETWAASNGVFSSTPGGGPNPSCMLAVGENDLEKVTALPNPFSNDIRLGNAENASIEIYDSLGKRVFSATDFTANSIDTSQFSSGLYFIKIQKENKVETKKK